MTKQPSGPSSPTISPARMLVCDWKLPRLNLPALAPADPVLIEFRPELTRRGAELESGSGVGIPVHAGTFLRERRVVLGSALLGRPPELRRILIHELFHFAWMRLGNRKRYGWESILAEEFDKRARGELGWSAELRKGELERGDRTRRTVKWREYACESFCDTAGWLHAGLRRHEEYTLARRWTERRKLFFVGLEQQPLAL